MNAAVVKPGELIVFHGMVSGARGTCLIVGVKARACSTPSMYRIIASFESSSGKIHQRLINEFMEGIEWSRISESYEA